jgi:Zn ribbon nucleic-acid-binding protein
MGDRWAKDATRDTRAMRASAMLAEMFDEDNCDMSDCGECGDCRERAFDEEMDRQFEAYREDRLLGI